MSNDNSATEQANTVNDKGKSDKKAEPKVKEKTTSQRQREMRQNKDIKVEELNEEFGEPCDGFEWKFIPEKEVKKHGKMVTIPAQWIKQRKPLTEEERKLAGERLQQHKKTAEHISYSSNLRKIWFYVKYLPDEIDETTPKKVLQNYKQRMAELKEYMRTEVYCIKKNLMIAAQRAEQKQAEAAEQKAN